MLDGTNEGGQRSITAFFPCERSQEHQLDPGVLLPRGLVAPPVAFLTLRRYKCPVGCVTLDGITTLARSYWLGHREEVEQFYHSLRGPVQLEGRKHGAVKLGMK
jgi:hypothetical protein